MNSRHRFGLAAVAVLAAAIASLLAAPELPERMATHWNVAGEPDGYMGRTVALAFIPVITALAVLAFGIIPRIDPLRENIAEFRPYYDWFVVLFSVYMTVVHLGVIAFNLGYDFEFSALILVGIGVLFGYMGILFPKAQRNWFIGIRTPWTMSSTTVWERTHRLGGRLFLLAGVLIVFAAFLGESAVYVVFAAAIIAGVVPIVYSYWLYERVDSADPHQLGP